MEKQSKDHFVFDDSVMQGWSMLNDGFQSVSILFCELTIPVER